MADLIVIDKCVTEYSENILPITSMFEGTPTINQAGDGTVTQSSTLAFEGSKSINYFCNTDTVVAQNTTFNFGDDLKSTTTNTGTHIFSMRVYNGTVLTTSFVVKVSVHLYINGLLNATYEYNLNTGTFNRSKWAVLSQSFSANATDLINFTFEMTVPPLADPNPNVSLNFDGFKLEFDNKNLGIPSVYSLPAAKNDIPDNFVIVDSLDKLPAPSAGVITLKPFTTYKFSDFVDMLTNRLVLGEGTVIQGTSSQNSGMINGGTPLITTSYSLDLNNISISNNGQVFSVNSNASTDNVFINDCTLKDNTTLGTVQNLASILFRSCSLSNNGVLNFDGTIGTIAADNALFIPSATNTCLRVLSTCTISRRIRIESSSFIVNGTSTGIDVSNSATIPDESYLLDNVNFSGSSSTYTAGVTSTSNKALFTRCKGITNTLVIGQMYMQGNATATVIGAPSTFVKVAGTTTAGELSKYLHSANRLTCDATIPRRFLVQCVLSFTSGNNQVCEFGFYDSTILGIRVPSKVVQTTSGAGVAENLVMFEIINQDQGDYLEVWAANNTSATNITVTSMNFIISQI